MLPSIAKLAEKHGIKPLKKFGQNFIFDESLCDKIVQFSKINKESYALEIGPGPSGLTRSILKSKIDNLTVIETDERCLPLLEEIKLTYPNLRIIHNDALRMPLKNLFTGKKLDIISNLPYNIGSPLLLGWLNQIEYINSMTLMLQKEVVDRITSPPNSKSYGRLSIICQIMCNVEKCFDVSPKAFYPSPKIWSSIVRLVPKDEVNKKMSGGSIKRLEKITALAFSGRRKMLKSSLKSLSSDIEKLLRDLDIDPELRAENLSPESYLKIAKTLKST